MIRLVVLLLLVGSLTGCLKIQGDFVMYKRVTCPKEKDEKADSEVEKPADAK